LRFEALVGVGSSDVWCDVYVLETVKAEGDGLNTEYRQCDLGWPFDEKNEFCARTGLASIPQAIIFNSRLVDLWISSLFSGCVSSLWLGVAS
jgi:hypothetical protein